MRILAELGKLFAHFAQERREGEHFGDFVIRAGYVRPELHGSDSYDA